MHLLFVRTIGAYSYYLSIAPRQLAMSIAKFLHISSFVLQGGNGCLLEEEANSHHGTRTVVFWRTTHTWHKQDAPEDQKRLFLPPRC